MAFGGTTRRRSRRSLRPEGLKIEAENRGRGGVLGEGRGSPPARRSGERCKLPKRGLGKRPSRNRILAHFSLKIMTPDGNNFDNFFLGINTKIYKY